MAIGPSIVVQFAKLWREIYTICTSYGFRTLIFPATNNSSLSVKLKKKIKIALKICLHYHLMQTAAFANNGRRHILLFIQGGRKITPH